MQSESLQEKAQSQWTRDSIISPRRGTILDRDGSTLAISATAYTASVSPRMVTDAENFSRLLAPVLNMEMDSILERASDRSKGGVTLKRQLTNEVARQLRAMLAQDKQSGAGALNGLYIEEDTRRYYPMGSFLCQLLGITTIDGVGQSGLEQSLNKYLTGKNGRVLSEIDGKGRLLTSGSNEYVAAVDGYDVTLTIDADIQAIVEQAAREAMTVNDAKAVRVLVMNPGTGEILAMCSKPDFDLNSPPRDDVDALNELMRNRIVTDAYEPGSTFKVLTTAIALETGVTNVSEGFYCSGSVVVEGGRIRCWSSAHGAQTMARGLENSCNPVFVELGLRLGIERFYDYMEAFGLGRVTGVDISGEASGILISRENCKRVDIARIGFGQSVALTPIQLLTAASATVNGGNLMKPYVVKQISSDDGEVVYMSEPSVVSNPISAKTSETMRGLLEGVVKNGGGKNAYLESYRVGGKTGTAQIYVDGVVSSDTHIGSFMGFAPIDDPEIAVLFIVDEATVKPDYGSTTAAPFAKQVIERTLIHLAVPSHGSFQDESTYLDVPDVVGMDTQKALRAIGQAGFTAVLDGTGRTVVGQLPKAGTQMASGSIITVYVETDGEYTSQNVEVPDVTGMSIGEANRLIVSYGLNMTIDGSGLATAQEPSAGTMVTRDTSVSVSFER
ncbi:MAG: penicillin-binding transpeptidase domain-containing protein [Clostridia bacterium]|nr:penicillin-binding transpeptidase domain-containing protein [Clostridia bacterium]